LKKTGTMVLIEVSTSELGQIFDLHPLHKPLNIASPVLHFVEIVLGDRLKEKSLEIEVREELDLFEKQKRRLVVLLEEGAAVVLIEV